LNEVGGDTNFRDNIGTVRWLKAKGHKLFVITARNHWVTSIQLLSWSLGRRFGWIWSGGGRKRNNRTGTTFSEVLNGLAAIIGNAESGIDIEGLNFGAEKESFSIITGFQGITN
jgi:hypothetical protein